MMSRSTLSVKPVALFIVMMLFGAGCGGKDSGAFKGPFGQVTGKVSFEGKPIPEGSQVLFQSTGIGASYAAIGTVNASGEYTLKHDGKLDVPGVAYQVQIMPPSKAAVGAADPLVGAKIAISKEAPPFPAKYSSPSKDLVFTVKEGKNSADFTLTK